MFLYLRNILQLILAPKSGWEDISHCGTEIDNLERHGLYPFIVLAALSVFVQKWHDPMISVPVLVVMCVVTLVSFFLAYYLSRVMFKMFLYHYCTTEPSEKKYSTVALYTVGLLCLSMMVYYWMPVKLGLEYLLPFVVAMILCKSTAYLGIRADKEFGFYVFACIVVILPPILVQDFFIWILS